MDQSLKRDNKRALYSISIVSLQHFLVDFICALTMYNVIMKQGSNASSILLYNFCAFALQMPLGLVADVLKRQNNNLIALLYLLVAAALLACGLSGSVILLGTGNSLFHLGGGIITVDQDKRNGFKGRGLGSFVAPGAIGLVLGTILKSRAVFLITAALVIYLILLAGLWLVLKDDDELTDTQIVLEKDMWPVIIGCLIVVVLRSYVGMSVFFSWKNTTSLVITSVICVAAGKMLGGFAAAKWGIRKTTAASLAVSAICYLLSENVLAGHLALLMFNMTMPLTLYILTERMKSTVGFAFGILTFALFLGVIPQSYGVPVIDGRLTGAIGSLLSLLILLKVMADGDKK